MTTLTRNKWKAKVLLNLFYTETLFLHSGVILDQKVIHGTFFYDRKKTRRKKQCILYLVWCEKHTPCRSRDSKGKQTSQSCLSSNFIFKAVERCSLVLRIRSVKEYVFPWAFLQDDSKTIWFPFENSRPGVDAVVPFNLGRYKTQHIYFGYVQDVQVLNISMRSRIGIVHLRNISWRCLGGVNSVQ